MAQTHAYWEHVDMFDNVDLGKERAFSAGYEYGRMLHEKGLHSALSMIEGLIRMQVEHTVERRRGVVERAERLVWLAATQLIESPVFPSTGASDEFREHFIQGAMHAVHKRGGSNRPTTAKLWRPRGVKA